MITTIVLGLLAIIILAICAGVMTAVIAAGMLSSKISSENKEERK